MFGHQPVHRRVAGSISKVVVPFCSHQPCMRTPFPPHSCQHVYCPYSVPCPGACEVHDGVLTCISLNIMVLSIFSCAAWPHVYLLKSNVCLELLILSGIIVFSNGPPPRARWMPCAEGSVTRAHQLSETSWSGQGAGLALKQDSRSFLSTKPLQGPESRGRTQVPVRKVHVQHVI